MSDEVKDNGPEVSQEQLEEAKNDPSKKIIEKDGQPKILERLNG